MKYSFLDILFPKFCVGCGRIGKYICPACLPTIKPILQSETICPMCEKHAFDGLTHPFCKTKYGLDGLVSFFHYRGVIKKALKELKYRFVTALIDEVVETIPEEKRIFCCSFSESQSLCIPIPLHPVKERLRGFNQAEVISKGLSSMLALSIETTKLKRMKHTHSQATVIHRKERFENMKNVFACETLLYNKRILLVDDIFTTGATMRDACRALKKAGAKEVFGVTIAR